MSIPFIPQNVVLLTGNGQNRLTWPIVVGATSYTIQRSTDGINFTTYATATTNNYVDAAATVGAEYWYTVSSTNSFGTSPAAASYPTSIVSCLPGQISLQYLIYNAKLRADKLNSEYLTYDEWVFNINQSMGELYDILVSKYGDNLFFAPPLQIPLSGQISYTMPDGSNYPLSQQIQGGTGNALACYKLNGVDLCISGTQSNIGNNSGWIPLPRTNWSDRDKYTIFPGQAANLFYGYQMSYALMGNQLYIFPPNTDSTLRIWYVPQLTQLLQDTDMLSYSISGWSEYVIIDAAMKAMIKEESLEKWNALDHCKQLQIERIETQAANRDVGQPNAVSNVRSTMGDPGFGGFGGGMGGFGGGGGFGGM
jgi:hypothetical protein